MRKSCALRAWLALAPVIACGCASTSPEAPFHDTAQLVEARTGHRIHWNQDGEDDRAAAQSIHALLAHDLSVEGAVEIALLENRSLQATYEELAIAQADLVQAGLLKNPVFGAGLAFPIAGDVATGGNLSVSEDFLSIFTLAAKKRIAGAALEAAKLRVGDAVLRATYDVEAAFFELQSATQVAAMRRTLLESGDAALDLAHRQHDAGNIADLDLANEEAMSEQLHTDLMRSEADVVTAHEKLARLLGVWGADSGFRVQEKLSELPGAEPPLGSLEAVAIDRRLDLKAARAEKDATWHLLTMTRDFRWMGGATAGGAFERAPERYSTLGPNASVELPIFDQKQATLARLEAELRAAVAREGALAIDIRSEVRDARSRLSATRAIVERYAKTVIPLREKVVTLSQQQYDAMLLGAYQLLQTKQSEVNAYREFIEALRDYWLARVELERATGGSLVTTASSPPQNRGPR